MKYTNFLNSETSPYLLQHIHNPVEWYPWCEEAFERAAREDKPVFLSIGYSTCHWCHVMARESFENEKIAKALNQNFISVKVDREERPDIDNVYMRICQAATGSGGWPMSIFMTPQKRPFFAGTYFPPEAFLQIVNALSGKWLNQRSSLTALSRQLEKATDNMSSDFSKGSTVSSEDHEAALMLDALKIFRSTFDSAYGGFGNAPKFPSPHNLMFLLATEPAMAEKTLTQMYMGGIFDHIGGGFSRYSTDNRWLLPHFEKMLYDNALLAIAYTMTYETSGKDFYRTVAEKILQYLMNEMLSPEGGFYSAQDADTDGQEGKYYLLTPEEIIELLGEKDGAAFCQHYNITKAGNYQGKSIPNLITLKSDAQYLSAQLAHKVNESLPAVYQYRKSRAKLHTDTKLLAGWNSLAAAALAFAGRILNRDDYLASARATMSFMAKYLQKDGSLLSGYTSGKASGPGFLDDYAFYIFALLQMYKATEEKEFIIKAFTLTKKTIHDFGDKENGGFFFSGTENEKLITNVKESYDGALPSGNAVMYYNLSRLAALPEGESAIATEHEMSMLNETLKKHRCFMNGQSANYPAGHCFYLLSLFPAKKIICRDDACRPGDDIL